MKTILVAAVAALLLAGCAGKVSQVAPNVTCDDTGCTVTSGLFVPYRSMIRSYQLEK